MRQVTITIPDEYYDNLIAFLKSIPDTTISNSQEEYNKFIQNLVLERAKNAKPENYQNWEDVKKELDLKYNFNN